MQSCGLKKYISYVYIYKFVLFSLKAKIFITPLKFKIANSGAE